jgi:hypothetical protein
MGAVAIVPFSGLFKYSSDPPEAAASDEDPW